MTSIARRAISACAGRGIEHHTFIRYPADARYSYCTRCGKPMRTEALDVPPPLYAQGTLLRLRKQFRHLYEPAMPRGPLTVIAVYRAQGMHTYTLARPTDPIGPSWRAYEEHLEECGGKR